MKKRIIFSNYDDMKNPYYGGGGAIAIHEVASRLSHRYDVTVFTGSYPDAKKEVIDHVQYIRLGLPWLPAKMSQLLYIFLLPFQVLTQHFDIWFESFTPPFSTGFLPLFTRKPVVGVCHFLLAKEKTQQYKLPFDTVEQFGLRFYQHIIALTEQTKNYILQHNAHAQIHIISNGMTVHHCPPTNARVPKHLLFIGRLEMSQKGLDLLLKAYAQVQTKIGVPLYIAGSGLPTDEAQLKNLITELRLESHVQLVGRVDGQKKQDMFCQAVALALPSRYETLSITALEALSYHLPIVCFDIPGLEWLHQKSALKVPGFSIEKYGQALLDIVKNKTLRQKTIANSLKFNKVESWETITQEYNSMIQKLTRA